ncbi:hypothetical protein [Bradyrhizobium sp. NP1]|uniref:hypothetical protein n=1 Tax=Bradyrhizobium sp. NP1 TaxID=3049772 RepID=UPI0025A57FEB|nr:hypothetical protein [Bradyrhizobium sp. NP1]WJR78209.1 hypothetical protein QOU61_36915 [Bradyrhizobium sp. NP1]
MAWIVRFILMLATPIAALFVARDALNFGIVQSLVATGLVAVVLVTVARWSVGRADRPADSSTSEPLS